MHSRLINKYKENTTILDKLNSVIDNHVTMPKKLDKDLIERCCKKHFFDFDIDKSHDFKVGYTDNERDDIRKLVTDIYQTIKEYQCQI
jgi:hypothetical protein